MMKRFPQDLTLQRTVPCLLQSVHMLSRKLTCAPFLASWPTESKFPWRSGIQRMSCSTKWHSFVHMCSLTFMHPTLVAGMFPLLPRTTVVGLNRGLNDENHSQCEHMVLDMPESSIYRSVKFNLVELTSASCTFFCELFGLFHLVASCKLARQ